MIDYRTQVENAVTTGWERGAKVGIIFQVTQDGNYIKDLLFPYGTDTLITNEG